MRVREERLKFSKNELFSCFSKKKREKICILKEKSISLQPRCNNSLYNEPCIKANVGRRLTSQTSWN